MPMHSSNSSCEVVANSIYFDFKRNEAFRYLMTMIQKIDESSQKIEDKFSGDRKFSEYDQRELKH